MLPAEIRMTALPLMAMLVFYLAQHYVLHFVAARIYSLMPPPVLSHGLWRMLVAWFVVQVQMEEEMAAQVEVVAEILRVRARMAARARAWAAVLFVAL